MLVIWIVIVVVLFAPLLLKRESFFDLRNKKENVSRKAEKAAQKNFVK